jgi:hypothetical protein
MPVYTFVEKSSGEEFDQVLSYDEMIQYLQDNPEVQQVFRMNLVDPVGIGITKPPADFMKNVIGKVKQAPGAHNPAIEKRWTVPREW